MTHAWKWLASLALIGGVAHGQAPAPTAPVPAAPNWAGMSPVQAANEVARCIARNQQAAAIGVLDMPLLAPEQGTTANGLLQNAGACAPPSGSLELTTTFLIGGMAEQLLVTKYRNVSPDVIKLIQPTVEPRTPEEDFALCIAEKWPADARAVILSSVGSPGEQLAANPILANISVCVPAGLTMRINPATVRALSAYALYRVSSQMEAGLKKIGGQ